MYSPNNDTNQITFYRTLEENIHNNDTGEHLILAGNFNLVQNPFID